MKNSTIWLEDPWSFYDRHDWMSSGEQAIWEIEREQREKIQGYKFKVQVCWDLCSGESNEIMNWLYNNVGEEGEEFLIDVPGLTESYLFHNDHNPEMNISDFYFKSGDHAMLFKLTWVGT
jgi:hypothetical protein